MAQTAIKRQMFQSDSDYSKKMKNGVSNGNTTHHPLEQLKMIAQEQGLDLTDRRFAEYMDSIDPIRHLREDFCYPKMKDLPKSKIWLIVDVFSCREGAWYFVFYSKSQSNIQDFWLSAYHSWLTY